jgi:hypothetical protein
LNALLKLCLFPLNEFNQVNPAVRKIRYFFPGKLKMRGWGIYRHYFFEKLFITKLDKAMNTSNRVFQKLSRVFFTVIVSGAVIMFMGNCKDDSNPQPSSYTISGSANGSQVVPSVAGTGTGTITGTYNPNSRVLTYTTGWNGLTGAPTSAGFYSGASGASGTAMGSPWTLANGITGTGSMNGAMTLTSEQARTLMDGNMYYSYGTSANPNGEVRGQMTATAVR